MKIRPIILSGGSGTRLWPVSRKRYPKQFAQFIGTHSLLMSTLDMLMAADFFEPPVIVANEDHKFFVLDILSRLKKDQIDVFLEPCGRNTAAAGLVAALAEKDQDVLHLLIPSDHVITDHKAFFEACKHAAKAAHEGRIALFGVKPTSPETGYGYIHSGQPTVWPHVLAIKSFKEKPDGPGAAALIAEGALWNSGIFLYNPQVLVDEIKQLAPELADLCQAAIEKAALDLGCKILDRLSYEKLKNISFDYLVMENTKRGAVVSCSMGWSDVGSWQALWTIGSKDKNGNVIKGDITTIDVKNSYIRSDGLTVGVIGLDNISVVATKDAVLVMPRERSQDVKTLVAQLEEQKNVTATEHSRVMRPWGWYEGVATGSRFQVKHIVVHPKQSLSLQMHHHRAEHWVVVAGTALVERDDIRQTMFANESMYIPKGAIHRLSNPGDVNLHLVEVQSGDYLGEDDIVRYSDKYGRVEPSNPPPAFTGDAASSSPLAGRKSGKA